MLAAFNSFEQQTHAACNIYGMLYEMSSRQNIINHPLILQYILCTQFS